VIGPRIAETQAKKVAAQAEIRTATCRPQMSRDDIAAIVTALGELATVVREADPADKADIYAKLKLTLTYQPEERLVEASIKPGLNMRKGFVPEVRLHQKTYASSRRSSLWSAARNERGRSGHQVVNGAGCCWRRRSRCCCVI
jgi:hypothetical protein